MFGRVYPQKSELKFKEFDIYRGHYCGICRSLKTKGFLSAMCLNYDMTFLKLLLNSLYDCKTISACRSCVCHPCKKHLELQDEYSPYVADMTIFLAYYKCLDDWQDDKNLLKLLYSLYLKKKVKGIQDKYSEKCNRILKCLTALSQMEITDNLEECANLFGSILGEVFTPNEDMWHETLFNTGFYLGKFIYIADAYEDIDEDIRKKRPNPLKAMYSLPDFEKEVKIILNMMASECVRYFEKLPLVDNIEIMRNILYSGIWQQKPKSKKE